jgi:hypothetical protein
MILVDFLENDHLPSKQVLLQTERHAHQVRHRASSAWKAGQM